MYYDTCERRAGRLPHGHGAGRAGARHPLARRAAAVRPAGVGPAPAAAAPPAAAPPLVCKQLKPCSRVSAVLLYCAGLCMRGECRTFALGMLVYACMCVCMCMLYMCTVCACLCMYVHTQGHTQRHITRAPSWHHAHAYTSICVHCIHTRTHMETPLFSLSLALTRTRARTQLA